MGEIWQIYKDRIQKNERNVSSAYFCRSSSFGMWSVPSILFFFCLEYGIGNYGLRGSNGGCASFLISLLSALSVGLEEKNHFQTFLGTARKKKSALLGKYIALLLCTFFSFLLAVGIFGAGFTFLLGKEGMTPGLCVKLIFALWLPSAALYGIHLFLDLTFPKSVSIAVGTGESLYPLFFLPVLGDGLWTFVPASWSARWAAYVTGMELNDTYRKMVQEH